MSEYLNPLDAVLMDLGAPLSGLADMTGLRAIVDCEQKDDDRWWLHVSVSRAKTIPTHLDMARVKMAFIGEERYAYSVWPPRENYVNIHANCLHLWACIGDDDGRILPEFSADLGGVRSI